MIVKGTGFDSVWGYGSRHTGCDEEWLRAQICADLQTVGFGKPRIRVKSDQEASTTSLQQAIEERRKDVGTALEYAQLGDSNNNGRSVGIMII